MRAPARAVTGATGYQLLASGLVDPSSCKPIDDGWFSSKEIWSHSPRRQRAGFLIDLAGDNHFDLLARYLNEQGVAWGAAIVFYSAKKGKVRGIQTQTKDFRCYRQKIWSRKLIRST